MKDLVLKKLSYCVGGKAKHENMVSSDFKG